MQKEAAWLLRELTGLVAGGVLDETSALRLRQHYAVAATPQGLGWGMILLAIGGAALIGLGVILIFAHNWENWIPEVRVALSLAPLLLGQIAAGYALRNGSRLWGEAAGLFTALAIGASIALIAQTYQFGGDLPRFLLTWILLALPLVYLLDSSAVAALCWIGVLGWTFTSNDFGWWRHSDTLQSALRLPAFLALASLPLPHLMRHIRLDRASSRVAWMLRVALLVLGLGLLIIGLPVDSDALLLIYASMAATAALGGRLYFSGVQNLWGNPLLATGRLGVFVIALLATMKELWRHLDIETSTLLVLPGLLGLLAVWLAWQLTKRDAWVWPALVAVLTPLLFLLSMLGSPGIAVVLGHGYALVLVAALIRTGLHEGRLGMANEGAALLAAIVLMRFFDSDLSYVVRGVGFIVTGVGFFMAVVWLRKRVRDAVA